MGVSLYLLARRLATDMAHALARTDLGYLESDQRRLVHTLKTTMADARIDVRDYEYAETRKEQLERAQEGRQCLEWLRQGLLAASEQGLFSAIEVASFSAQIDRIMDALA